MESKKGLVVRVSAYDGSIKFPLPCGSWFRGILIPAENNLFFMEVNSKVYIQKYFPQGCCEMIKEVDVPMDVIETILVSAAAADKANDCSDQIRSLAK